VARRLCGQVKVNSAKDAIQELRPFLNIHGDALFILAVGWLLGALRAYGPYAILAVFGEQGTAKSFFCRFLHNIIDPHSATLRALPREDRDLYIAAFNGFALSYDNVSRLAEWLSDALCRLSTGGSFSKRQLYTDLEEILTALNRPIIFNGIENFVERADLGDRIISMLLEPIAKVDRKLEKKLKAEFRAKHPRVLGALLDAVSEGLRNYPAIEEQYNDTEWRKAQNAELPRLADFALWVMSCETALWEKGEFQEAYEDNINMVTENGNRT
jgi:hypothetical protein